MKRIYRITLNDLYDIVETTCHKINDLITEFYAKNRSQFVDSVKYYLPQIAAHWCLIMYAHRRNVGMENIKHWGSELSAFFNGIAKVQLKTGDNPSTRLKAVRQAWAEATEDMIREIYSKFKEEGVTDDQGIQEAVNEFFENNVEIMHVLSIQNMAEINQYVYRLTGSEDETDISIQNRNRRRRR